MTEQQPMKMAAAEALYDTTAPASFSLFTIGIAGRLEEVLDPVPGVLSFLATGSFDGTSRASTTCRRSTSSGTARATTRRTSWSPTGRSGYMIVTVEGINEVQRQESQQFGPGDYMPVIPMTYWTFRLMIGFGCWPR